MITDKAKMIVDGEDTFVCFSVPLRDAQKCMSEIKGGKQYTIEVRQHRGKRSLDANALYWELLGRLHKALKISSAYCHNLMLRRYGTLERIDGKPVYLVIPDTDEAARQADEAETYHIRPTSQTRMGNDGKQYRTYMLLKGSHDYDTAEMAALINGMMEECSQQGIDTAVERVRLL